VVRPQLQIGEDSRLNAMAMSAAAFPFNNLALLQCVCRALVLVSSPVTINGAPVRVLIRAQRRSPVALTLFFRTRRPSAYGGRRALDHHIHRRPFIAFGDCRAHAMART
jgi:hypothetical protein